jgi:hypothetical protein
MTIGKMSRTAELLHQPSAATAAEFAAKQEALAAELNRRMLARPDVDRLVGAGNRPMLENNSHNFFRFMTSLFRGYEPAVLIETAQWVFRAYRSHGFQTSYWPANLDTAVGILREQLSATAFAESYPFFEWLIVHIPDFVKSSDEALLAGPAPSHGDAPHG